LEYLRWRFQDCPSGKGIVFLAWDGDTLASHYALTPVDLVVRGEQRLAALSGTTMTHPAYRGRGLFTALAEEAFACLERQGGALVFGFPNIQSHRVFVRDLGWRDIHEIPMLRKQWEPESPPKAEPIPEIRAAQGFDFRFDALFAEAAQRSTVLCRKDAAYLTWRFGGNPGYRTAVYGDEREISAWCVYIPYGAGLQIVDMLYGGRPACAAALVRHVVWRAVQSGLQWVSLWLNVADPLHLELEKEGFMNGAPVTYFSGRTLGKGLEEDVMCRYGNWHISMACSDNF
jgi:GNAT superfamily N-acetyltransferase